MKRLLTILVATIQISCLPATGTEFKGIRLPLTQLTEQTDLLQLHSLLLSTAMVQRRAGGYGTAFCADYNLVITNHHVIYHEAWQRYHDGIELVFFSLEPNGYMLRESVRVPMHVVRADENHDLALLAPDDDTFVCRPIPLATKEPTTSEFVWRFGFNNGWRIAHGVYRQITDFRMSADLEMQAHGTMSTFEIHDGHGASGGPIVNLSGELVGVTTRFSRDVEVYDDESSGELRIKINHYVFSPRLETIRNLIRDKAENLK